MVGMMQSAGFAQVEQRSHQLPGDWPRAPRHVALERAEHPGLRRRLHRRVAEGWAVALVVAGEGGLGEDGLAIGAEPGGGLQRPQRHFLRRAADALEQVLPELDLWRASGRDGHAQQDCQRHQANRSHLAPTGTRPTVTDRAGPGRRGPRADPALSSRASPSNRAPGRGSSRPCPCHWGPAARRGTRHRRRT